MSTAPIAEWTALVELAAALGFTVELVEYCESPDSPGLLGAGLGVCVYVKRVIRIRQAMREPDRCFVLTHELDHARGFIAGAGRDYHAGLDRAHTAAHEARLRAIGEELYPVEISSRTPVSGGQ
jgi:hypothetical protein